MEELVSLVDLISKQKTHQIDVVDELSNQETKIAKLYKILKDNNYKDSENVVELVYGSVNSQEKFRKLKNRLFQKLVNSIFFLDQNDSLYSDKLNAASNCYKNFAAFRLLIGYQKRDVAVSIIEKTFQFSKKYDFTDLNYMITSFLCTHYISHTLNKSKYNRYRDLKKYYQRALIAESDIEELHGQFSISLSKSSSGLKQDQLEYYQNKIISIRRAQGKIQTQRYNFVAYIFQTNIYLETNRYSKILDIVEEGINFFKEKGVESRDVMFIFKLRSGIANLLLKRYRAAEQDFIHSIGISRPYSTNWYSTYSYYFALNLTRNHYIDAYSILSIVQNSKGFEKTHPLLVQQFKIKEAYVQFLIELSKIDPSESKEKPLRRFRLNRFLNDVPTYSKDKRGVNISILIIQMLLLVQNKKHGEIIDKLDALNMYSHRYLRGDNTFRSNCFIKMLTKLPDAGYHPIRWQRYVKKFRQRLDEHPFELSYHNLDLEVIPFETLYDLVIEMLEQQQGRKRSA